MTLAFKLLIDFLPEIGQSHKNLEDSFPKCIVPKFKQIITAVCGASSNLCSFPMKIILKVKREVGEERDCNQNHFFLKMKMYYLGGSDPHLRKTPATNNCNRYGYIMLLRDDAQTKV